MAAFGTPNTIKSVVIIEDGKGVHLSMLQFDCRGALWLRWICLEVWDPSEDSFADPADWWKKSGPEAD